MGLQGFNNLSHPWINIGPVSPLMPLSPGDMGKNPNIGNNDPNAPGGLNGWFSTLSMVMANRYFTELTKIPAVRQKSTAGGLGTGEGYIPANATFVSIEDGTITFNIPDQGYITVAIADIDLPVVINTPAESPGWVGFFQDAKSTIGYAKSGLGATSSFLTKTKFGRSVGYMEGVTLSEMRMQGELTKSAFKSTTKTLGVVAFGAEAVVNGYGVYQYGVNGANAPGAVSPGDAFVSTSAGALSIWGGPIGAAIGLGITFGNLPIFRPTPHGYMFPVSPADATSVQMPVGATNYNLWYDKFIHQR